MRFFTPPCTLRALLPLLLVASWPASSGAQTSDTAACAAALASTAALSAALITPCSDERTAAMALQLLEAQRKQAPSAASKNWPEWLKEDIIRRQIVELTLAIKGLREQGVAEGATLSERQAAVALFQGDATSAVDVLESMLIVKKQVALSLRRQGVLLRTHDPSRAASVLELAVAQNPDDIDLLQQAADSQLAIGQISRAQKWQQQMLALAKTAASKTASANIEPYRDARHRLASAERALGDSAYLLGNTGEAQQHYARAQGIWQGLQKTGAADSPWQSCWQNELARLARADAASRK